MTNGMVERYQTNSSATMMGYDYHHQDGGSGSLSGVFDAAFSAAASTSSRRNYPLTHYEGVTSSAMHQVMNLHYRKRVYPLGAPVLFRISYPLPPNR